MQGERGCIAQACPVLRPHQNQLGRAGEQQGQPTATSPSADAVAFLSACRAYQVERKKKNVQRAREREKGEKNARSQQLPNNWHFCFLELLLGARNLAGLPVERGVNASPQPDFCGRRLLRSAFLSGRAIKAQQLSLLSFCSY